MNGLEGLGFQVEEHRACVPVPPGAFTSDQVRVQRSRATPSTRLMVGLPGKHRYVLSLKQNTRVGGVRVDLPPVLER